MTRGHTPRVVVFGSLNMDLVVRVQRFPSPGETLSGQQFQALPGGKGANQAAACARLGVETALIGRVGRDAFGQDLRTVLEASGVDVSSIAVGEGPTGTAHIQVDARGENSIVVIPGANHEVDDSDLKRLEDCLFGASVLLLQLELPLPQVLAAARMAFRAGVPVILDPAPAMALPRELLQICAVITPNEQEAARLVSHATADLAPSRLAAALLDQGARAVLLKRGAQGADWFDGRRHLHCPAHPVQAVDTVAAGDAFNGGLGAALAEGCSTEEALAWGAATAAVAVTRHGAQASLPTRPEMLAQLQRAPTLFSSLDLPGVPS